MLHVRKSSLSLLSTPMLDNLLKCGRNSFLITTGSKWLSCSLYEVLFIALLFLQIGDRSDSTVYIKSKVKAAEEVNVNIESETGW